MRTDEEPIVVEQTFNAPAETVWKAITEIDLMRQWYFNDIPDFKAKVGFEARFSVTNERRDFLHVWRVTEVVPLKKLTYNWKYENYPGDAFVVFELFDQGNATTLKLTTHVKENFPDDIPEFKRESGLAGWEYFIQKSLREFLEEG